MSGVQRIAQKVSRVGWERMDCINILTWHFWEGQPAFLRWLEEIKVLPVTSEVTDLYSQPENQDQPISI